VIALSLVALSPIGARGQTPFYQGKTIAMVQATSPGGTGDMMVRAVVPFLKKYIPGGPAIVSEYMPGAGGMKAVNHIYKGVPADGLTIGNVGGGMVANAILGEPGVLYDLDRLVYLGSPHNSYHWLFMSRSEAGLGSIDKLRAASGVRIGGQSVGHTVYIVGRLFAYVLGMKEPKFVVGYSGTELDLALQRGEIDARVNNADTLLKRNPDWLAKGLVKLHAMLEVPKGDKHPGYPGLPEIEEFARTERDRKLLALQRAFRQAGSPYILPPGTPKEQVAILQEAMRKTFRDPEFRKEYKKLVGDDPTPLMPEEMERAIRAIPRDRETIDFFKVLAGPEPLPPR
jgi:tripartite-type tricarboxylate transporter receptor subunit TctC